VVTARCCSADDGMGGRDFSGTEPHPSADLSTNRILQSSDYRGITLNFRVGQVFQRVEEYWECLAPDCRKLYWEVRWMPPGPGLPKCLRLSFVSQALVSPSPGGFEASFSPIPPAVKA
jgi:hypothetical protein